MTSKENSVRYTKRNVQTILHKENLAWFSFYAILVVREKGLKARRSQLIQGVFDPQSRSSLIVIFLVLSSFRAKSVNFCFCDKTPWPKATRGVAYFWSMKIVLAYLEWFYIPFISITHLGRSSHFCVSGLSEVDSSARSWERTYVLTPWPASWLCQQRFQQCVHGEMVKSLGSQWKRHFSPKGNVLLSSHTSHA